MKLSVCGKGGSGKSVVVALLARAARQRGFEVLVVDADESNSGLFRLLGLPEPPSPIMELVGGRSGLKGKMRNGEVLPWIEIAPEDLAPPHVIRADGVSLVALGKIHKALEGCACPIGVIGREFLNKLRLRPGELVLVDTEAGVEHFGRGVEEGADGVLMVVEPSLESVTLAERIAGFASGLSKPLWAVLNKVPSASLVERLRKEVEGRGVEVVGIIPYDEGVFEACLSGKPVGDGRAVEAAGEVLEALMEVKGI